MMLEVLSEITPLSDKDFLYIVERNKSEFTYPLHHHKEYELNFIENGAGARRIVGDNIEEIGNYDLVFIGSEDLEHVWEQWNCTSKSIREITIQFSPEVLSSLIETNQFERIKTMFNMAKNGLSFPIEVIIRVYHKIEELARSKGFEAVIKFLELLDELSFYIDDAKALSSSSFAKSDVTPDSRRIEKVRKYISEHYTEKIRLAQLAEIVGMSTAAFSRFFKLRTGGSLSDYIINIRLGYATRLLVDSTMSIAEICYSCGFNNLSNFNRIFKSKKDCSPKEFRNIYHKNKVIV